MSFIIAFCFLIGILVGGALLSFVELGRNAWNFLHNAEKKPPERNQFLVQEKKPCSYTVNILSFPTSTVVYKHVLYLARTVTNLDMSSAHIRSA